MHKKLFLPWKRWQDWPRSWQWRASFWWNSTSHNERKPNNNKTIENIRNNTNFIKDVTANRCFVPRSTTISLLLCKLRTENHSSPRCLVLYLQTTCQGRCQEGRLMWLRETVNFKSSHSEGGQILFPCLISSKWTEGACSSTLMLECSKWDCENSNFTQSGKAVPNSKRTQKPLTAGELSWRKNVEKFKAGGWNFKLRLGVIFKATLSRTSPFQW